MSALLAILLAACPGERKPKPPPAQVWSWSRMSVSGPETTYVSRWDERTGVVSQEWRATRPGEWREPLRHPPEWWSANPRGEAKVMRLLVDWTERVEARQAPSPRPADPLIGRASP